MAEMLKLKVDFKELQVLKKDFRFKRPSQVVAAIRTVLNDEAFAVMNRARKDVMPRIFNIRNKWVQSSVLVEKAEGRNVKAMRAITGAKKRWGGNKGKPFTGLRDQEFGAVTRDPDIPTLTSRISGSIKKKVSMPHRYHRLGDIKSPSDFKGKSPEHRIIVMFRALEGQNYKGAMFIRKSKKMKTGIYKFKGRWRGRDNKTHKGIVQIKDLSKGTVRTVPRPWMKTSIKKTISQKIISRFWLKNVRRFTKKTR